MTGSLCPEQDERESEDELDFWQRIADNLNPPPPFEDPDDAGELDVQVSREACRVCGELGACAYDSEGRPMIHTDDDLEDT